MKRGLVALFALISLPAGATGIYIDAGISVASSDTTGAPKLSPAYPVDDRNSESGENEIASIALGYEWDSGWYAELGAFEGESSSSASAFGTTYATDSYTEHTTMAGTDTDTSGQFLLAGYRFSVSESISLFLEGGATGFRTRTETKVYERSTTYGPTGVSTARNDTRSKTDEDSDSYIAGAGISFGIGPALGTLEVRHFGESEETLTLIGGRVYLDALF